MNPNDQHLEKLLDAYFEGTLDATSHEDLDRLITSSGAAREKFWERADIEGSLETWAARSRGESMAMPTPPPRLSAAWKRHLPAISGWAAAAALLVAWLLQTHPSQKSLPHVAGDAGRLPPPVVAVTNDTPVAYLSRVNGLAADNHMRPGQSLVAGREVTIREGLLELDFYSGARVSIQGPARFVPDSDMRLTVAEGTVQVDVPDSAKGFKLVLPDGTVTDFGTSFGVVVTQEKTSRLQVSRGEVELAGTRDGGAAKRIFQGQAFSLAETNGSRPIAYHPMAVKTSLETNSAADDQRRAEGWNELCAELATDPSLLVHFRFLADEEGSREILNRAAAADTPRTGTVIAAEWSRGRWEGKPALAFHNPADRVRVDIPGEYPQATFLAWVKVDSLPRRYNGLFLSEFGIPGETHWQVSPDGRFWFGVRPKEERDDWSFHRAFSEPVIFPADFGTWRLLATSYDAGTREVIHYVDGTEVHRSVIEDSVPLRFGRATLGNFFDPAPSEHVKQPGLGEEWSFRNWSGAIDEFLLFSRVLDKSEIARVHEAGRVN
ncbi:MAG: LamG-like jellyroll fold domain-containing protein [Verrucomicrobiota bacterium]